VHYRYCGWTAVKVFATDFERELDGVNEQIEAAKSGAARSQLRERRSFVDERFRDLRELLNGKARIPRAAIRKHVQKITDNGIYSGLECGDYDGAVGGNWTERLPVHFNWLTAA